MMLADIHREFRHRGPAKGHPKKTGQEERNVAERDDDRGLHFATATQLPSAPIATADPV
jgi:hypothetical protein